MAKSKTNYVCTECGADYKQWQGQCTSCQAWNTLKAFNVGTSSKSSQTFVSANQDGFAGTTSSVQVLKDIDLQSIPRISTNIQEFDRVLGGGLVAGSVVLIGGHPGAGKSTLLLQTLCQLANELPALYVTGEESLQQVAMRANRLSLPVDKLKMLSETNVEQIIQAAQQHQPKVIVIDSVQVMHIESISSSAGSVTQVRECAALLTRFAKQTNTALLLVGHVTKDGSLAGPKVLEHIIDCSIMLEGSDDSPFRTLRGIKNRFGAVNELGVFAMMENGLREVTNPSAIFLSRANEISSGSVVTVIWEGTRPLLVELQALVDDSHGHPRRVAVGLDQNRLAMLLAVLHRHGGLMVGDQDVFVNVVGGVKVLETSVDLALLLAIVSSFKNKPLPRDLLIFGEVGLSGEIRPVPSGQQRLQEAAKHGFKRAIAPKANVPKKGIEGMEVIAVEKLATALDYFR